MTDTNVYCTILIVHAQQHIQKVSNVRTAFPLTITWFNIDHQGLPVGCYNDDQSSPWQQLTIWQSIKPNKGVGQNADQSEKSEMGQPSNTKANIHSTSSLTSDRYVQSYVVMKPNRGGQALNAIYRDALFRFGSWCYSGIPSETHHWLCDSLLASYNSTTTLLLPQYTHLRYHTAHPSLDPC